MNYRVLEQLEIIVWKYVIVCINYHLVIKLKIKLLNEWMFKMKNLFQII